MWGFIFLNDYIIVIIFFLLVFVGYLIFYLIVNVLVDYKEDFPLIEFFWTVFPIAFLILIAFQSLPILFHIDNISNRVLRIKAIGHQWYWRYEYIDFWNTGYSVGLEFDTYIIPEKELDSGCFRLLETDFRPTLPFNVETRVIVTRTDVIHAWTIPSIGIKTDANPGRLNQIKLNRARSGVFYGQCSEICGANHRFIPISIEFIGSHEFIFWFICRENRKGV